MTSAYINNDHTIKVYGLEDSGGDELTSASITFQIYDDEDVAVVGASGALLQVGTSNDYEGEVDKDIINLMEQGGEYTVRVTGSDGGNDFEFDIPVRCVRRRV